jgi:predicted extracellular nuclease
VPKYGHFAGILVTTHFFAHDPSIARLRRLLTIGTLCLVAASHILAIDMRLRKLITPVFSLTLAGVILTGVIDLPTARAASDNVVISEFRTRGPQGDNDEFVELYNASSAPVNIGSWTLRASSNTGVAGVRATVPTGVTLNPGCHYLFVNSTATTGYSGSVTGDRTYTTGVVDNGGVAIFDGPAGVGGLVDAVGLNTTSVYREGTVLTPLTTNEDRGYERKPGGSSGNSQDTDNNTNDFAVVQPTNPQNLSSACVSTITGITATGAATPNSIDAGNTTRLTVAVVPSNAPGLAVTADLSPLGGSSNASFYDDGTHGDVTAGDRVFSLSYTVSGNSGFGTKIINATATDGLGHTAAASITVTVNPPFFSIMQIQGTGSRSPREGQTVKTSGVVYDLRTDGFWMQDPNGDGDPNTSDGIFVVTNSSPSVHKGDSVSVAGLVAENFATGDPSAAPQTNINAASVTILTTGNPLPPPITITAADFDPNGGIDQLERYEGMRVHVDTLSVVAPTGGSITESTATSASNGVFFGVIPGLPRPFRGAGIELPGTAPSGSACCVPSWNGAPQRIRVDSLTLTITSPVDVTTGAVVSNVTGPLDFAQHTYTIVAETVPSVSGNGSAVAVPAAAATEFTVATFHMQRFFDTVNDPVAVDEVLTASAFNTRLNKASLAIRNVMMTPDVIGVEEVENLSTLQALANKVNNDAVAAGQTNPGYSAYLVEGNDSAGLDVGFLVKSRITVNSVNQFGKDDTFVQPDGSSALVNDRPPLLLDATVTNQGESSRFMAIVVHQLGMNGIDDSNDGSRIRAKRRAQSEYLANLVQSFQMANTSAKIVTLGTFNAFSVNDGYVDAMGTIEGNPTPADQVVLSSSDLVDPNMTDLETTLSPDQQYSFINLGTAETLDHVLVSQGMLGDVTRFAVARNNADFPEVYRNFANRPERISDHDMAVAYFKLPQDKTPPLLTLPADLSVEATSGSGAVVTFDASAQDAVDGSTTVTCNPASGSTFPLGTSTVSCTTQDGRHNVANGQFHVEVVDTTAPVFTLPADFTVEGTSAAGAVVTYTASALDIVDGSTAVFCNPAPGSTFPLGTNTVSCTTQDAHHNVTNGEFHVDVVDSKPPVLSLPADINVEAITANGTVVTYSATASDAIDGVTAVVCSPASGSTFPLGNTTVSCSAQDRHHNVANGEFHVNVTDSKAPVLTLPADIKVEAVNANGAVVTYSANATDGIDGPVAVVCSPASASTFPLGITTVSCTAQDSHHNVANGEFHVDVADTTPPVLTLPADITVTTNSTGAVVTYSASALDAVDGPIAVLCSAASGSTFPVGTTTVSCTAQDTHHNAANGQFKVKVLANLTTPPIVNVTGVVDGASYVLGSVPVAGCSTSPGSSPVAVNASLSLTGGTTNGVGNFKATCSGAKDVAGNVALPASATYTVSYVWSGFLGLDSDLNQAGSTIPLKWTLTNSQGRFAGNLSSFVSMKFAANVDCAGTPEGSAFPAATPGDTSPAYFGGAFQFNWKTTGLAAGCYSVLLGLDDGSTRSAIVQLKSKDEIDTLARVLGSKHDGHAKDNKGHDQDDRRGWSFLEKVEDHKPHNPPSPVVPSKPTKK